MNARPLTWAGAWQAIAVSATLFTGGASLMAAAQAYLLKALGYACLLSGLIVFLVVMWMLRKQDIAERQAAPAHPKGEKVLTGSVSAGPAEMHVPRGTTEQIEDNRNEHIVDRFGLVQADGGIRPYERPEVDLLTLAERQKLFMIAPDMHDWWRGKRAGSHTWSLFRLRAGLWLSVAEIDGLDEEKQRELWEVVPDALDWYMRDKKF